MIRFKYLKKSILLLLVAFIVTVLITGGSFAADKPPGDIVYETEYVELWSQHGDKWNKEDKSLDKTLAELKKKFGKTPNIIHIMYDDNSLGEVGIPEMNKVLGFDTPRINQMADDGISFTRMYTEPACTPTRTAALTGRLAVRAGMTRVGFPVDGTGLHKDEVTIAEVLSEAGYKTAFFGKAHQGDIEQSYMQNQGFDVANFSMYNQFPLMTWQPPVAAAGVVEGLLPFQWDKDYTLDQNFRPLGYLNQLEARKGEKAKVFGGTTIPDYKKLLVANQLQTLDFVSKNADSDKPFYVAYWPHVYDPIRKPTDLTTSANTWFAQSVVEFDSNVGQILDLLKQKGIAENTLVIVMADNGPMLELAPIGPHEAIFRGGKGDHLEGGIRVPAFAWWPGVIEPDQVVGDMVTVYDLFTTFARLGNAMDEIPTDRVIDGVDQTALLLNGDGHSRRDYAHVYTGTELAASIKQQIKRVWEGERHGLVGKNFHDLYKDNREEFAKMPQFLWAWPAFDHMKARHENLMKKYPNRPPTHGKPYEGIENIPPAAQALADQVPVR
jgi:arylsulfatase A-like enzyme